jgi:threonine/homoserine/homoserine lactone efflux protein
MHTFLTVLTIVLLLSVLGVLVAGMIGMVRDDNPRRSNKLMQWRVILQGVTLVLFAVLLFLLRS